MKAIARSFVYWPLMDTQIEALVKQCTKCQQAAKAPRRLDPIPWPTPHGPWSRVHLDFAGPIDGITYLVIVDSYSKWPEVIPLKSTSSDTTVTHLRRLFGQHGIPDILVSDNGTQFTSAAFQNFCSRLSINHLRSPPYHPQSNGQAERFVDTFKRALLKSRGEGTTEEILQNFLFVYRTTPNPATPEGISPAEALMGRKLRTVHHALLPHKPTGRLSTEPNNEFENGALVYARDYRPGSKTWIEGVIMKRRGKVLYEVSTTAGCLVRHKNQLRPRASATSRELPDNPIPLDILLDTFNLPNPVQQAPKPDTPIADLLPRRWSDRRRRPTTRLQVNPHSKHYR